MFLRFFPILSMISIRSLFLPLFTVSLGHPLHWHNCDTSHDVMCAWLLRVFSLSRFFSSLLASSFSHFFSILSVHCLCFLVFHSSGQRFHWYNSDSPHDIMNFCPSSRSLSHASQLPLHSPCAFPSFFPLPFYYSLLVFPIHQVIASIGITMITLMI